MTEPTEPTLLDVRAALAGAYEIEAPLGRGGMSFVYLARERRLDRRVAIKVLSPELAVDDAYRRLFLHEARTVAALTHPNIVPIHAVGEVGDLSLPPHAHAVIMMPSAPARIVVAREFTCHTPGETGANSTSAMPA